MKRTPRRVTIDLDWPIAIRSDLKHSSHVAVFGLARLWTNAQADRGVSFLRNPADESKADLRRFHLPLLFVMKRVLCKQGAGAFRCQSGPPQVRQQYGVRFPVSAES